MKLQKFDLQKALNGAKVVTRDGKELTQLHIFDNVESHYPVYGCIENSIARWTKDGCFLNNDSKNENDLFLSVEVQSIWVNVYKDANGYLWVGGDYFATFELAQNYATNQKYLMRPYLKTIEITDEL
jgi:hypothetical protein